MTSSELNPVDVIFLGPSLPHDEARSILPDAILLSPATMGDVLGASNRYRPRSISIVDGTFLSTMSVFHKEILYALDQGTWVLGASSMGALRAAECADYGMIGVGQIYDALVSGEIEDDDEVALTHADAESGYRPLSDAMVTIRATLHAACDAGLISSEESAALIALQKARYFPDRRLSSVAADAEMLGLPDPRIAELRAWVRGNVVDPKRADAIALLHRVAALPSEPIPVEDRPGLVVSGAFSSTLARDIFVDPENTPELTHDRIRRFASLHRPEYPSLVRIARSRMVLGHLSVALGGQPTDEEREQARARLAQRVGVPVEELDAFFRENDVSAFAEKSIIGLDAAVHRIEHSWLSRSRMGALTSGVIAEMVLNGTYGQIKEEAAMQYRLAGNVQFDPPPDAQTILTTFMSLTGFDPRMTWEEFVDLDDHDTFTEVLAIMEVAVKAHHALFGTGLISGGDDHLILDHGPMQSRGR